MKKQASEPLPMSVEEILHRGWDQVDVVFVTGDAYVDHLSFAAALLGRLLEKHGFRVAILAQPDWKSCDAWRKFGKPRLGFAVSAGNMDSMVNHYTANRKVRNVDAYSPGGKIGLRPDRATAVYCQRAREAFPGVPILAGGVEASLRRLAHYDYWSDKVRRSVLLDAKADMLFFGMGELSLVEVVKRLDAGTPIHEIRDVPGTAYPLGASELFTASTGNAENGDETKKSREINFADLPENILELPSYEEVCADKSAFARMTKMIFAELNPYSGRPLLQVHGTEGVVVNPPQRPLTTEEMDAVYALPVTRKEHPAYGEKKVPALEVVKDSVQAVRGCYGGCAFCAIAAHEGKIVQSRSRESVLHEIKMLAEDVHFSGTVTDIGGPTANMYGTGCKNPEAEKVCRRVSCLYPEICKNLNVDHGEYLSLLRGARNIPGVRNVFIASGIRTDLARRNPEFMEEMVAHHVGGHLKVAPEHVSENVLRCMRKTQIADFDAFAEDFDHASEKAGNDVYLVPYFIASHPGCDLENAVELAVYLHQNGYKPEQVQDFLPAPFDISTCMYYTGIDPETGEEIHVARSEKERKLQRAMLQYFMPENYFLVREVLERTGRTDLIGGSAECLIPSQPPEDAGKPRVERANPSRGGYRQQSVSDTARREQRAFQELQDSRRKPKEGRDFRESERRERWPREDREERSPWMRAPRDDRREERAPEERRHWKSPENRRDEGGYEDRGDSGFRGKRNSRYEENRGSREGFRRRDDENSGRRENDGNFGRRENREPREFRDNREFREPRESRGRDGDFRGGRREEGYSGGDRNRERDRNRGDSRREGNDFRRGGNWEKRFREDDRGRPPREGRRDGEKQEDRRSIIIPTRKNKQEIDTWSQKDDSQLKELRRRGADYQDGPPKRERQERRHSGYDDRRDGENRGSRDGFRRRDDENRGSRDGFRRRDDGNRGPRDGFRGRDDENRGSREGFRRRDDESRGPREGFRRRDDESRGPREGFRRRDDGNRGSRDGFRRRDDENRGPREGFRRRDEGNRGFRDGFRGRDGENRSRFRDEQD